MFSALYATMTDGRTIEMWYQCDVKGYQPGGQNWRFGKGQPSLLNYPGDHQWQMYLSLWKFWTIHNSQKMVCLLKKLENHHDILTDGFATSDINQARALATVLNEWFVE